MGSLFLKGKGASAVEKGYIWTYAPRQFTLLLILILSFGVNAHAGKQKNFNRIDDRQPKKASSRASNSEASNSTSPRALPPLPAGVAELKFSEFYDPIGPYGLKYSQKLSGLDGKRVRILGYMVQQGSPAPGVLLLTPVPLKLHEEEYGLADDLPPATVHVFVPTSRDQVVPFTPGLLLLTGTLSIGNREEPDGRISTVRLYLDPPSQKQKATSSAPMKRKPNRSSNTAPRAPKRF
jgi:hypothetical protein